jgi:hypothetical protein
MGDLLVIARTVMRELYQSKELLLLSTARYGWTITAFAVSEGSMVPASAPREILYRMLCNARPVTNSILSRGEEWTLRHLKELLQVRRRVPVIDLTKSLILRRVADGTPRMFFVCAHETGQFLDEYALHLGASQSDWGAFNAIKVIRRADRDRKMRDYTQRALGAFRELQRIEISVNLSPTITEDRPYKIRLSAIQRMRGSPLFLGHTREIGQAFDGEFNLQQSCYFCQGMTGWKFVKTDWTDKEKRDQLISSDWKNRGQNAHACAEIMVSQQCAHNQISRGRPWNW